MRSVLLAFQAECGGLREFLAATAAEEALYPKLNELGVALQLQDRTNIGLVLRGSLNRRKYNYVVAIIALYGALERYVESVVEKYVRLIASLAGQYNNLPEPIIKHHYNQSIEYLWLMKESRIRTTEQPGDVLGRLAGCVAGNQKFELNYRAFTLRSGNMNQERVKQLCLHAGVEVTARRLSRTPSYRSRYSKTTTDPVEDLNDEEVQKLFVGVDELVEARNQVAHGITNVDEIEDRAILESRLSGVEAYVEAIHDIMEQEVIGFSIVAGHTPELAPLIDVFDHSIVCIEHRAGEIKVGDVIAMTMQEPMEPVRSGAIESIEIDRVRQQTVQGAPDLKIGMKVAMRASKKGHYYLVPADLLLALRA